MAATLMEPWPTASFGIGPAAVGNLAEDEGELESGNDEATPVAKEGKFRIKTFCRFRPACERRAVLAESAAKATVTGVALPLHQRVALLRRSHPELSHKEAIEQVIATQRAQKLLEQQQADGVVPQTTSHPGRASSVVSIQSGRRGTVLAMSPGCGLRPFEFGHVFDETASQAVVFQQCGLKLVVDLVNGINGAIVVYGQTGSGKTHTMFGPPECTQPQERGLAFSVAGAVVEAVQERRAAGLDVKLHLSYVENFGNQLLDLLEGNRAGEAGARRVLTGEFEVPVDNMADFDRELARGNERKRMAATAMNEHSTRAHTILVLRLEQTLEGSPVTSQLILADLGGSERVTKSRANEGAKSAGFGTWRDYYASRERIQEANNINQGLLALKRCIQALDERQRTGRAIPIPYRDSRLTELLEPALGGLARTSILVCCNPEADQAEETVQTLRFGETCSAIEHMHTVRSDMSSGVVAALKQLDEQVAAVEGKIREKEQWEWRQQVRTDLVDANDDSTARVNVNEEMELGGLGAVEFLPDTGSAEQLEVQHTVWGQVLVGAEEERAELEALLDKRRQLLGEA